MNTNMLIFFSPLYHSRVAGSVVAASKVIVLPIRASILPGPGATRKAKSSGRWAGAGSKQGNFKKEECHINENRRLVWVKI